MTHQAIYRNCCCFPCDNPIDELPETLKISGSISFQVKTCRKMKNYKANPTPEFGQSFCNGETFEVVCNPVSNTPSDTNFVPVGDPKCENCEEVSPDYPNFLEWERQSLLNVRYTFTGLLYRVNFLGLSRYVANSPLQVPNSENSVNFSWDVSLSVQGEDWKTTFDCLQIDCCAEGCFPNFEPEFSVFCEGTQSVNDSFQQSGTNWYPEIRLVCAEAPLIDLDPQKENCNWINFDIEDFKQDGSFFGKKITQIYIDGEPNPNQSPPISWPPVLQNCPGKQLQCNDSLPCDCEYVPCTSCSYSECVPESAIGFNDIRPFRDVRFVCKNFQSFYGDYICHRLAYRNPTNTAQKNFFSCNNPLSCPDFPDFPELNAPNVANSFYATRTWDGGNGWDGNFTREFKPFSGPNWITEIEFWIATNHTINTDETFIVIEPVSDNDK